MSFREGMLRARGQIVFTAALVCSTAAIVYLEYLDVTDRIRNQFIAAQATTGLETPQLTLEWGRWAIELGESAFHADPSAPGNRAAALNAAVLGLAHDMGPPAQHRLAMEQVLEVLENDIPAAAHAVAPALALVAAAAPDFAPRIAELLAR